MQELTIYEKAVLETPQRPFGPLEVLTASWGSMRPERKRLARKSLLALPLTFFKPHLVFLEAWMKLQERVIVRPPNLS